MRIVHKKPGRLIAAALIATALGLGPLGCGESMPTPDETAKNAPPAPPKRPNAVKGARGLIPKSIKDHT
jgi:hypothetical protein